jgi:quercetin dioxygenase-like cupin family protein/iron-sulfur cluster repair protein YtfE (RIC family)
MQKFSLEFKERSVQSLFTSGEARVVQASFEPGQGLTKHLAKHTVNLIVLTGRVKLTVKGEAQELKAHEMVIIEPATEHAIEAIEKSTLLLNLIPEPGSEPAAARPGEGAGVKHTTAFDQPDLIEKVAPELRCFVEDHIEVCQALDAAKKGFDIEQYKKTLSIVGEELSRHFVYEEEILFPRLNKVLGGADVGPVPRLLQEHEKIRSIYCSASDLVERFQTDTNVEGPLETQMLNLIELLWSHIGKEDNHLFPMAGRLLSDDDKKAIEREVKERDLAHV